MFIRHLIAKKPDNHIYRSEAYVFAHVPRPLGQSTPPNGPQSRLETLSSTTTLWCFRRFHDKGLLEAPSQEVNCVGTRSVHH